MSREEIVQKFINNPTYLTNGAELLSKAWNTPKESIVKARAIARDRIKMGNVTDTENQFSASVEKKGIENVLIIGDIHLPFELEGYLEFCKKVYKDYNCNRVIFIGDIIDNHYSSYHETDANGMGGLQELELAVEKVKEWYKAFPKADVIIGNHDRIIMRKAQTSAIPTMWIREYKDVLGTPGWNFTESVTYNNVEYIHGEGGTARTKMKKDLQSVVQGHLHTQAYCEHLVGKNFRIFGMQVGCGIDHKSYAMAYAKNFGKPAIGCGVVLNNGTQPINVLMDL